MGAGIITKYTYVVGAEQATAPTPDAPEQDADPINLDFVNSIATDSASTGADVDLAALSTAALRLTNASLASVRSIGAPTVRKYLMLINATGASITIKNESAATAANRILTGTNADIILANNTTLWCYYDTTSSRWRVTDIRPIEDDSITNGKLANMAQSTIKGRAAGAGTGDPTDLTATQATAILDNFVGDSGSGGTKGLVPAPATGDAAAAKFLKADGTWAVTPGGSGSSALAIRSVSSTDTATNADDVLLLSGASFTETLFTAVGNSGKVLRIRHAGTSLSQVYTIDGNSSETIGGSANTVLHTNGEVLTIVSDNSNWIIIGRSYESEWETYTLTIGSTGTPPTPGTNNNKAQWRRQGDSIQIRYDFKQTTVGTAGSGTYLFPLPSGATIDTTKFPTTYMNNAGVGIAGPAYGFTGSAHFGGMAVVYDASNFVIHIGDHQNASNAVGQPQYGIGNTTVGWSFLATVPISGWNS